MSGRLAGFVHVTNPASGEAEAFGPGQWVPDWAAALITNPAAWTDGEIPRVKSYEPVEPNGALRGNASRAAWAEHADLLGVAYGSDATRNEIKAAVEAATLTG